jgi:3-oxoacyl-[acyl-carrier-protein] synthase II
MNLRRVVVTGLGALTPIGNNVEDFWAGLVNGVSGAARITRFDPEKYKTHFACEVKNFDPADFLDRKDYRRMDLFTIFALVTAQEAFTDSGLNQEKIDGDRAGVIWGSGIGGITTFQQEVSRSAQVMAHRDTTLSLYQK